MESRACARICDPTDFSRFKSADAAQCLLTIPYITCYITLKNMKIVKGRNFSDLSNKVIGCAIEVHKTLGSGLLESTYQQCLAHELSINQIEFKIEYPLPVKYKGDTLGLWL